MQTALDELSLDPPHLVLRQLRHYLSRQADHGRVIRLRENAIELVTISAISQELICQQLEFSSGSELMFKLWLERSKSVGS